MVDRRRFSSEQGTTLAELLVVITLLSVIGAITTVGVVRGFNAQLSATEVADTLDGTRIATQRVRDFTRGADEVCASSSATSLVLWADDDDDGLVTNAEIDIFELVGPVGDEVFQRRVPLTAGSEVQLIRDDIINGTLFEYDVAPSDQPADLVCTDGVSVTGGPSRTRSVSVTFTVDHPNPTSPDLTTETVVQVRNAGLEEDPRDPPVADFTFSCPPGTETCSFDASTSSDTDGLVIAYAWDFGDGATATGATPSHTFPVGDVDYDVTLTVRDNDGLSTPLMMTVRPGLTGANAAPVASFTFTCTGRICSFDSSGSTDDSGIVSYRWDFGDGSAPVVQAGTNIVHTFPSDAVFAVTLTVTDNDPTPLTHDMIRSVSASSAAMRVESLTAVGSAATGSPSRWTATITVQMSLTTAGNPGAGVTVSGTAKAGASEDVSCSTDVSGKCTFTVTGIQSTKDLVVTITNASAPSTYTYAPGQNKTNGVTAVKNTTVSSP